MGRMSAGTPAALNLAAPQLSRPAWRSLFSQLPFARPQPPRRRSMIASQGVREDARTWDPRWSATHKSASEWVRSCPQSGDESFGTRRRPSTPGGLVHVPPNPLEVLPDACPVCFILAPGSILQLTLRVEARCFRLTLFGDAGGLWRLYSSVAVLALQTRRWRGSTRRTPMGVQGLTAATRCWPSELNWNLRTGMSWLRPSSLGRRHRRESPRRAALRWRWCGSRGHRDR